MLKNGQNSSEAGTGKHLLVPQTPCGYLGWQDRYKEHQILEEQE